MAANGHRRRIEKLEGRLKPRLAPFKSEPEEARWERVVVQLRELIARRSLEDLSPYGPDKCDRDTQRRAQEELKAFVEWRTRRGRGNYG
jgi:hypothetical protein